MGRSSEWAARAIEAALDAIVTIDSAGVVVGVNAAAEAMFGYSRAEAVGRPLADLVIPPEYRERHRAGLARLVAGGEPHILDRRIELHALRRGGEPFPVELIVTRSGPDRFTGFVRDLTALRAAERRRHQMQRLLEASERLACMGSWGLELPGLQAVWSDGMYAMYGLEPGAADPGIDMLLDLTHPEDRAAVAAVLDDVVAHPERIPEEGVALDYRIVRRDGTVRVVSAHGRVERDEDGRPARWVGSAQDVTDQRLSERELQAHYAVSQALRDWESFEEGIVGLLRRLGTALECPIGELWTVESEQGALTCRAFWRAPDLDPGEFEAAALGLTLAPGDGLPGRAWQQARPLLVADVAADPAFLRREHATQAGLHTGLAFPAGDDPPLAVLAFYATDRRAPSERLTRTLTGIGRELGRFLARRRADLEVGRLSPREIEVLRLAADGHTGPRIAEQLVVSPATVKTHFEHIYEKLGVGDRAAAVAHALRIGLIR
ncbi:MAG TPA: PAS domain S-box protein [Solirubrobacteraceae bacterium]|nr:PAS domain S-box protein [Solirubrobacteraceae bacterium]